MARGIYERLETMERNICSHLGVSPPNVHNTQKMKVDDDSPKTDGIQAQRPPRKSRRTNSTVTKPATKIHSYPQHSADRLQGNKGRTSPYFNKESQDDNDCAHDRTPPFDEHVNYQSVIDEPPCISDLTPTKHFDDEKPVTVTWEETNPHAYTSGKIAPTSETPPSAAYRVSGPHLPSPRTAADVETLSRNVSATKTQSAAATEGASRDSVAVGNERSPIEEDENYESCQENISIDTPLQEKHPLAVETFPGPDTDEDDSSMESGGIPNSPLDLPHCRRRPHSLLLPYLVYRTRMCPSHDILCEPEIVEKCCAKNLHAHQYQYKENLSLSVGLIAALGSCRFKTVTLLINTEIGKQFTADGNHSLPIMTQFPILDLPPVLQALVVQRVAKNSFADLYRLRSTCKSMRALADKGGVYASFHLFNYPWSLGRRHTLLRRCYEEGNPSTLYVKGVEYFCGLDRLDEGLRLLKRAANAGYERAF
ncbi:hypothetical protein YC2023_049080 [Brassica napus]